MERRYISPEMDIIEFDTNDVITTSSDLGGEKPGSTDVINVNTMEKLVRFLLIKNKQLNNKTSCALTQH